MPGTKGDDLEGRPQLSKSCGMGAPGASSLPPTLVLQAPQLSLLGPGGLRTMRSPAPSLIPVRCGRRCSRICVADGEHVDPPAVGRGGLDPAAARSRLAPQCSISGPRGSRPHAEVPLVLSKRHVPAGVPRACEGRAPARGGTAQSRLLALEVGVAVQGQWHGHVGSVQLVPAPRQAAEAADAGPRHAGPGAWRSPDSLRSGPLRPRPRPRPRGPPGAAAAPPPGLGWPPTERRAGRQPCEARAACAGLERGAGEGRG